MSEERKKKCEKVYAVFMVEKAKTIQIEYFKGKFKIEIHSF